MTSFNPLLKNPEVKRQLKIDRTRQVLASELLKAWIIEYSVRHVACQTVPVGQEA